VFSVGSSDVIKVHMGVVSRGQIIFQTFIAALTPPCHSSGHFAIFIHLRMLSSVHPSMCLPHPGDGGSEVLKCEGTRPPQGHKAANTIIETNVMRAGHHEACSAAQLSEQRYPRS
jgi:hypothetical protein